MGRIEKIEQEIQALSPDLTHHASPDFWAFYRALPLAMSAARRSSVRAPQAGSAAPSASLQEDRPLLVGPRRRSLSRPRGRSNGRACLVLDWQPCRLRSAAWLTSPGARHVVPALGAVLE